MALQLRQSKGTTHGEHEDHKLRAEFESSLGSFGYEMIKQTVSGRYYKHPKFDVYIFTTKKRYSVRFFVPQSTYEAKNAEYHSVGKLEDILYNR